MCDLQQRPAVKAFLAPQFVRRLCKLFWSVVIDLGLTDCLTTSAHSGGTPYSGFSWRNRQRFFRGGAKAPPTYRIDYKKVSKLPFILVFGCCFFSLKHTLRAFLLLMIWTLSSPVRLFTSILLGFLQRCLFCLGRPSWKWNCICILLTPWAKTVSCKYSKLCLKASWGPMKSV